MSNKVNELIKIIEQALIGNYVTAGPEFESLSEDDDGSMSILMDVKISAFHCDEGLITPEPVGICFDYRAKDDEWLIIIGDDADELVVDRANLFSVMYYFSLQLDAERKAALTQQEAEPAASVPQGVERKCSECADARAGVALYCVSCLNHDGWYLVDPTEAQDVEEWIAANRHWEFKTKVDSSKDNNWVIAETKLRTFLSQRDAGCVRVPVEYADAAQFLLDRLNDFEGEINDDGSAREWYGHVAPAIGRVEAMLTASKESV